MEHKSGFVNIIGRPNVGKSTLINALVGEKVSIVSPKVQTTRQRVLGILNGENWQMVFSDTPGYLKPKYLLQESMMRSVNEALDDADIILYMVEVGEHPEKHEWWMDRLKKLKVPVFLLINKVDLSDQETLERRIKEWQAAFPFPEERIWPISATEGFNLPKLHERLLELLPEHPPYFPPEQYTDRSERYLASEVVREKIFLYYKQEIPYSVEVIVQQFKEEEEIIRIMADIIVARESQKPILIGKGGLALKRIGTAARADLEEAFRKQVFLELFVKVRENWRENKNYLKDYGYDV